MKRGTVLGGIGVIVAVALVLLTALGDARVLFAFGAGGPAVLLLAEARTRRPTNR